MDRKATRVGVVAAEVAARCRIDGEWQLRAAAAVIANGREYTGLDAAGDVGRISRVDQASGLELREDLILDGIRQMCAVRDAGLRIEDGVERLLTQLAIFD